MGFFDSLFRKKDGCSADPGRSLRGDIMLTVKQSGNEEMWTEFLEDAKRYLASPHDGGAERGIKLWYVDTIGGPTLVQPALRKVMVNGREVCPVTGFDVARGRGTLAQVVAVASVSPTDEEVAVRTTPYR